MSWIGSSGAMDIPGLPVLLSIRRSSLNRWGLAAYLVWIEGRVMFGKAFVNNQELGDLYLSFDHNNDFLTITKQQGPLALWGPVLILEWPRLERIAEGAMHFFGFVKNKEGAFDSCVLRFLPLADEAEVSRGGNEVPRAGGGVLIPFPENGKRAGKV